MRNNSLRIALALLLAAGLGLSTAFAGLNETLKAIQQSEFTFTRTVSEVPFFPMGWVQDAFYPRAVFHDRLGLQPDGVVVENTVGLGLFLPAYVGKRDMLLLGADLASDNLDIKSGPYPDQRILRLTPVIAWLRQVNPQDMVTVFAAPVFSKELRGDQPWGWSGYGGIVGLHTYSDKFQLLYGTAYQNSFGQRTWYPYLGVLWLPTPKLSLSLVFPWPTLSYVPRDRWLLSLGVAPGGSSWVTHANGIETTETFGSWNLNAGVGYRLQGKFWLFASGGVTGLRGLTIGGSAQRRFETKPSSVFTLAVQFRP
jgi:hypothetical protein